MISAREIRCYEHPPTVSDSKDCIVMYNSVIYSMKKEMRVRQTLVIFGKGQLQVNVKYICHIEEMLLMFSWKILNA